MNVADLFATLRIKPDQRSFDAADKLIDGVKTALVGLAAIAGAHVLANMIEETVQLGAKVHDLSQEAGISTDTLQELGVVANENSSSMEAMAGGLGHLQNNMKAAASGSKEQEAAFAKLGVRITDVHGRLRPVEDVFEDIAINQSKITNETEKGVAIFQTLGRTGRELIPTMNDIANKGMGNLIAEAHELGAVLSEDAINALDNFHDTEERVKTALIGLRNQAVVALLPTLQRMADSFLEWVKANRQMIQLKLQVVLNMLIKALQGIAVAADLALKVFGFLEDHWELIKVSVMGLAAAMAIFKAESVAAAIASGAAWVIANIPLVLLAALMTGLILLVDDIITAFQGGDSVLQDFFEKRFGVDLVDTLTRTAGGIKAAFEAVVTWATDKLEALIKLGEKIGATIYNLIHGDTQFQLDAENTGNQMSAMKLQRIRQMIGNNASREKLDQASASLGIFGGLSDQERDAYYTSVVQAPAGIDRVVRAPANAPAATTTVQAPVTINVNGATDPQQTAALVRDQVKDHFDNQMVQAASGVGGVW